MDTWIRKDSFRERGGEVRESCWDWENRLRHNDDRGFGGTMHEYFIRYAVCMELWSEVHLISIQVKYKTVCRAVSLPFTSTSIYMFSC